MHKKVTSLTFEEFMEEFVPDSATFEPAPPATGKNLRSRNAVPAVQPVPCPEVNPFKDIGEYANEREMYGSITEALNNAGICPGYRFVATPHKGDASEKSGQAVDCGLYPEEALPKLELKEGGGYGRTDWSWIDLAIECKKNPAIQDPFDEDKPDDEPTAEKRKEVLGQILSYIEIIFQYQHRTFQYMLLFLGNDARLVRFDRSGIFVTQRFDYKTNGLQLARFLWHYAHLPPALRGHDTTAERIDHYSEEGKRLRHRMHRILKRGSNKYAAKTFRKTLDYEWPWWRLEVPDEENAGKPRRFFVGKPHFQAPGVVGRTTRGYIALEDDEQKMEIVYLKDAWRVVNDEIEQEGKTLEFLRANEVKYVPTLVCHGDIPNQHTRSQTVWPKYHPGQQCKLKTHHHYRLVVEEVGKPLDQFDNGFQLVTVLWHCLMAHEQAYEAGMIHRDISAGNLLIYRRPDGVWQGLLNDWELAKHLDQQESEEGRQPDRTGTWQFMSAKSLNNHTKTIVIQDELESFLHVVLYIALRLLPHNCTDEEVPRLLYNYFDDYSPLSDGYRCGPLKATSMKTGKIDVEQYIKGKVEPNQALEFLFFKPAEEVPPTAQGDSQPVAPPASSSAGAPAPPKHPLDAIVREILLWIGAYYVLAGDGVSRAPAPEVEAEEPVSEEVAEIMRAEAEAQDRAEKIKQKKRKEAGSTTPPPPDTTTLAPAFELAVSTPVVSQAVLEARARNLESHKPMLTLLVTALKKNKWPKEDRCPDRKPKKHWSPPDRIPAGSASPKGTKRDSAALGDDAPRTPPKRSKAA